MAREGDLLRVAAKLQEAALGSEAWPEALSSFSTLFGSAWTVVGAFARDPSPRYAWVTQDADGAPDHLVVFRDRYNTPDSNPAIKALVTAPPGSIVAREHTFSDRQWSSEPLYREIYRPRGLYHGLGMCVLNNDSHLALIGINRPRAAGRFSEREIEKLRQVVPHLQCSLELFLRITALQAHSHAHEAAWELLGCGVLLLDRAGAVLWTSAKARALLAVADGLVVRNGLLTATVASDAAALAATIHDALLARRERGLRPGGALRVSRRSRKRALSVLVSPLRIEQCFVRAPAAVVFVTDPEWKPASPAEIYRRLYDLTSREAAVAVSLVAGAGLAETAVALGISVHTARTHLRGLFRKTETRRQGELVARLARATPGLA